MFDNDSWSIMFVLTVLHHTITEMRGGKGGESEVNEEIIPPRPGFDLRTLSTPSPCLGDARHA